MSKGETHKKIQRLLTEGGKNDPTAISYIRTKLMLKGIYPERYGPDTDDPPQILPILDKFIENLLGSSK
jgi:hypothetical protein